MRIRADARKCAVFLVLMFDRRRLGSAGGRGFRKTESCSSARLEHHTDNVGVGGSSPPGTTKPWGASSVG